MIWLRRAVALGLASAFILAFPAVLFVLLLTTVVIEPQYLKEAVQRTSAYDVLVTDVLPRLVVSQFEDTPVARVMSEEQIGAAVQRVVSVEWVQATTEEAIDQVVPYLTGERPTFAVHVDFEPAKFALAEELAALAPLPALRLEAVERDILVLIPDGGTITEVVFPQLRTLRDAVITLRSVAYVGAIALAALLIVLSLIGGRSLRGKLQWFAASVGAAALLAWLLALGIEGAAPDFIRDQVTSNPYAVDDLAVAGILGDLMGEVARQTVAPAILAARALSIGACLVFLATLIGIPRPRTHL